jgi:DNA polymerase I
VLVETFKLGQDVHTRTAAEVFGVDLAKVTKQERRVGKTLNFALLYQQGAFATAKQIGVTSKEAKEYIERYFARFATVKPFMDGTIKQGAVDGYTETYNGRRRYFANLASTNGFLRSMDERAAFNAVLQGSNADLIKLAMNNLDKEFAKAGIQYRLILQVHDELVMEVSKADEKATRDLLKKTMELGQPLKVPVLVEVGSGTDWAECK